MLFNKACEELTGYHPDEVIGRDLMDLLVPQAWSNRVRQRFDDSLHAPAIQPAEFPWLTVSGEERLISWRCTAVKIGNDALPHILGIGIDLTEERRAEQVARNQSDLLAQFFESTITGVALLDRKFNFIRVNPTYAHICQRDPASFSGLNYFDLHPADLKPVFEQVIQSKRHYETKSYPFECSEYRGSGKKFWDWSVMPVINRDNQVESLLLTLHETAGRCEIDQGLQEASEKMRRISRQLLDVDQQDQRRISDKLFEQIRQELGVLRFMLESTLLERTGASDDRLRDMLNATSDLVHSVRRLAHEPRPAMLDDLGLLSTLMWLFDRHRNQAGLDVQFKHSGLEAQLPPEIETAVFRITQEALSNIVRHARVARAEVAVQASDAMVVVKVADQGGGFDHATTDRMGDGAGLSGMREHATLLGGSLTIDSEIDLGTTITAELPLDGPPDASAGCDSSGPFPLTAYPAAHP